ncbi:hypothetical protein SFRURICE_009746, partial [Spodoptera frugiperda]
HKNQPQSPVKPTKYESSTATMRFREATTWERLQSMKRALVYTTHGVAWVPHRYVSDIKQIASACARAELRNFIPGIPKSDQLCQNTTIKHYFSQLSSTKAYTLNVMRVRCVIAQKGVEGGARAYPHRTPTLHAPVRLINAVMSL